MSPDILAFIIALGLLCVATAVFFWFIIRPLAKNIWWLLPFSWLFAGPLVHLALVVVFAGFFPLFLLANWLDRLRKRKW